MKVFDAYSAYYDLLYKDKDYKAETNYVKQLINSNNEKAESILELGCGTGVHACLLANEGFVVMGIDQSTTMLTKAKERGLEEHLGSRIRFECGDIRKVSLSHKFDVVISLFHVMSYMETNSDLSAVFKVVRDHLKPGGIFIFDCWHGPAVLNDRPVNRKKQFENDNILVTRVSTPVMNVEKHIVDVKFNICIVNKENHQKNDLEEIHRMRYLFPDELEGIAGQNELKLIRSEEWMTGKPLSENTWNACYIYKHS